MRLMYVDYNLFIYYYASCKQNNAYIFCVQIFSEGEARSKTIHTFQLYATGPEKLPKTALKWTSF